MTGEELYKRYFDAMHDQGVGLDDFDELEAQDREAWERLAVSVGDRSTLEHQRDLLWTDVSQTIETLKRGDELPLIHKDALEKFFERTLERRGAEAMLEGFMHEFGDSVIEKPSSPPDPNPFASTIERLERALEEVRA